MAGLDPNIAALLTETVTYQAKSGRDQYGQDTWAAPVQLKAYPTFGARQIEKPDGTIYTSTQTLFFDGSNATVQGFQLGDLFTAVGVAGGHTLEAVQIAGTFSPGPSLGEPMYEWLVEVSL